MKLSETEKQIIELVRETVGVEWTNPYVSISKRGLYISLTENDDDDKYLTWREFERIVTDGHEDDVARDIALLEKSLKRMKRTLSPNDQAQRRRDYE